MDTNIDDEVFDMQSRNDQFDPEKYRRTLKEKLGIANLPTPKLSHLNKIDHVPAWSSVAVAKEAAPGLSMSQLSPMNKIDTGREGSAVTNESKPDLLTVPAAVEGQSPVANGAEAGVEAPDANLAPANAILMDFLGIVDEQEQKAKDVPHKMMLRGLHLHLYKNRDKIAKAMSDGAK